jgi:NTP pyrophosphatase (non-canonical NTP hydrolase)
MLNEPALSIKDIVATAHACAVAKGWWDGPMSEMRSFPALIALIHSEASEALEEFRNGHELTDIYHTPDSEKPEGIPIELADIIIRIADLCGSSGIDLEGAIRQKMAYNATRPRRHGGKLA